MKHHPFLFDNFPRSVLAVQGKDRVKFLHNLLTHDIKGLVPQQGRLACLLDRQGKIRFACIAHSCANELLLEIDPEHGAIALEALHQYLISEEVVLHDQTNEYRIIPIHGPSSDQLLKKIWPTCELPEISLSHRDGPADSGVRFIVRWDLFHLPGYHLWVEPKKKDAIQTLLMEAGKELHLELGNQELFDSMRIQAGVPWPNAEIDESVILNELDSEEWMSFTKGCYVGQEIVARIKYRAHPPRLLKKFILQGTELPPQKSALELERKPVGIITSSSFSPDRERIIALGFLNYGITASQLRVKTNSGEISATMA